MGSSTILIVDDDCDVRRALTELLEDEGYAVAGAANGRAALDMIRGGVRPALILLDLMMPGMNGWDFRNAQLRDPELSAVPVVIVTASGFTQDAIRTELGIHRAHPEADSSHDPPRRHRAPDGRCLTADA